MKLLFDENLSPRLPRLIGGEFSGSRHVRDCGLLGAPDEAIWQHARLQKFAIVSKDSDFYQRALLFGHPPKIIWLRLGNCHRDRIAARLVESKPLLKIFEIDPLEAVLVL